MPLILEPVNLDLRLVMSRPVKIFASPYIDYAGETPDNAIPIYAVGSAMEAEKLIIATCSLAADGKHYIMREIPSGGGGDEIFNGIQAATAKLHHVHGRDEFQRYCKCGKGDRPILGPIGTQVRRGSSAELVDKLEAEVVKLREQVEDLKEDRRTYQAKVRELERKLEQYENEEEALKRRLGLKMQALRENGDGEA